MASAAPLWSEEDAYLHPTAYASENIAGCLYVYTNAHPPVATSISLAFHAHSANTSHAFQHRLCDIHAIQLHVPSSMRMVGSVVIHTDSDTPTTVFFHKDMYNGARPHAWGGMRLLDALRQYTELVPSTKQPQLYLVQPDSALRSAHTSPQYSDDLAAQPAPRSAPRSFAAWAHTTRLSVLAQFSHVTRGARQSGEALMAHPLVRRAAPASTEQSNAQAGPYMVSESSGTPATAGPLEFDAARVYLAKWAGQVAQEGERNRVEEHDALDNLDIDTLLGESAIPACPLVPTHATPLNGATWETLLKSGADTSTMAARIFHCGIAPDARAAVWPYLFGAIPMVRDEAARDAAWAEKERMYDALTAMWYSKPDAALSEAAAESKHRIWIDVLRADTKDPFFDAQVDHDAAQKRAETSGWQRLATEGHTRQPSAHLYALSELLLNFVLFAELYGEPYALPPVHGYVQGMSDLCLVCYAACAGDQPRAFWCFVGVMRSMGANYMSDQQGMCNELVTLQKLLAELCPTLYSFLHALDALNLFFCFRWILVLYKREFALPDVLRLWDAIFSAGWSSPGMDPQWPLCKHFELFVGLAILESHSKLILRHLRSFDEVLQYIHSLAHHMDVHVVLRRAEALVYRLRSRTSTPGTPLEEGLRALVFQ
ncbi:GTPase activating protein [Malassezia vespertilionis]|uniref:Gyp7p n=1 Tax=Malassezia vespertilionis TaxID=2020962 RepID=A0A2N1JDT7_9BASI|nr:GTPase activating protein [Malassezia vespertilionis]PKI84703.1 Gyp7p [Malassezia vespertilionis]WFD06005.1 GTPase activating protein [Malassezia vespertilionis]